MHIKAEGMTQFDIFQVFVENSVNSGLKHPRNLGVLLTLFQPEGANYAHNITASTPAFKTPNYISGIHRFVTKILSKIDIYKKYGFTSR